jgi:hypothetical protein
MLTGRILCGDVRYTIERRLGTMYHCHCSICRRGGGASFTTSAAVATADFSVVESSRGIRRHFCSRCGLPLYASAEKAPQILLLRCGTLDEDPQVRPSFHIHVMAFDGAVGPEHIQRLYYAGV